MKCKAAPTIVPAVLSETAPCSQSLNSIVMYRFHPSVEYPTITAYLDPELPGQQRRPAMG
uniref:Uncharacterized protein n=1 Tax=Cryptococcus bacillisporus CA1280 TaxID=1296109 RepID=A0A0D0TE97_CRYGA|nr:hypothetical protein I312_06025 [Cryptococcus bacillisporus CA1280]